MKVRSWTRLPGDPDMVTDTILFTMQLNINYIHYSIYLYIICIHVHHMCVCERAHARVGAFVVCVYVHVCVSVYV